MASIGPDSALDDGFHRYRRYLPHWRAPGATYAVVWKLYEYQPLLGPPERTMTVSALRHFDGVRYDLLAYVVMPDHVHALVRPRGAFKLHEIVHSWKSFTARVLQRDHGRRGRIWLTDYYNRIVRDEREYRDTATYIVGNPAESWPEITS